MILAVIWMVFNPSLTGYFIIGGLAGYALTGVQSLSRTMAGLFAPASKSAEFFSFFAVAGNLPHSLVQPRSDCWLPGSPSTS